VKVSRHVVVSAAISTAIVASGFPLRAAAAAFAAGVFVDIDHLLDYFFTSRRISFDVKDLFYKCENHLLSTAYLLLHSYELAAALLAAAYFTRSAVLGGAFAGFAAHLFMDAIYKIRKYPNKPLGYFLLYRIFILKARFYEVYK